MKIDQKRIVSTDSPSMRRIRDVLAKADEQLDGRTIAECACISFLTFQNCYRQLLLDAGLIHVSGWKHNHHGPFVPLYAAGPQVGKPPAKPKKIEHRLTVKKWKERTGYLEYQKALRRLARPRDPVMKALIKETVAP